MLDRLSLSMRASHILVAMLFVIALVFAFIAWSTGDRFYLRLATEALIFAGLALSVDILLGYTRLLPLGQALFFGFGAYVSALVLREVPSFWAAIGIVFLSTLVVGLAGGLIAAGVGSGFTGVGRLSMHSEEERIAELWRTERALSPSGKRTSLQLTPRLRLGALGISGTF